MTLFHFINCVALTYSPYIILYRSNGLLEWSLLWKCARGGVAYFLTQLIKMMLLATFIPVSEHDDFSVTMEFVKCSVDVIDFLGLHLTMKVFMAKSDRKILLTALGWGTAQSVATRFLPLWVGARGIEFDWVYIQGSLHSNIQLVFLLTTCTFLWILNRNDVSVTMVTISSLSLVLICYKSFIFAMTSSIINSWTLVAVHALTAMGCGLLALSLHSNIIK